MSVEGRALAAGRRVRARRAAAALLLLAGVLVPAAPSVATPRLVVPRSVAVGGSRAFGSVLVRWQESTDSAAVAVLVSMGGAEVAYAVLTNASPTLTIDAITDIDSIRGSIRAAFGAGGRSGQLDGEFRWSVGGQTHQYRGFIAAWPPYPGGLAATWMENRPFGDTHESSL